MNLTTIMLALFLAASPAINRGAVCQGSIASATCSNLEAEDGGTVSFNFGTSLLLGAFTDRNGASHVDTKWALTYAGNGIYQLVGKYKGGMTVQTVKMNCPVKGDRSSCRWEVLSGATL